MAMYVTVAQVKADLVDSALYDSVDYDQALEEMITNASRLIDREVGGWPDYFAASGSATRYFDGSGEGDQWIDPMTTLTSVAVAESGGRAASDYTTWTVDTDFYVWPYNYAAISQPIQKLIVDNYSGAKGVFTRSRKGVKVTGVFGYSTSAPEPVKQACKVQALRWFMRAKQGYQDASASAALGEMLYVQELDPDVKRLLASYKIGNMVI
jgi:peptidoglycan/xylan/chitin deacetylase (PgdA/CDA1 family)